MAGGRVAIWLIGAGGAVGSSVALGICALRRGLIDTTGMVTAHPSFAGVNLDDPAQFALGGHETRPVDIATSASQVGGRRPAYPPYLVDACREDLDRMTRHVRPAVSPRDPREFIRRFQSDVREFATTVGCDQVVVVNVASTEAEFARHDCHDSARRVRDVIEAGRFEALPESSWVAWASVEAGWPYVNFTPSLGADIPAVRELAIEKRVPIAGSDGKTGETLLKTVLAPMFAARNLQVQSWVGHNLLGNRDGQTLSDPARRATKLRNKDRVVADCLGYSPQTITGIEYVESLDDWKTAWDHIQFEGFLGVGMSMQVTWQGCDSALAAPLVLDLARLAALAHRRNEGGPMAHTAVFFKNPMAGGPQDFAAQWQSLLEYARR